MTTIRDSDATRDDDPRRDGTSDARPRDDRAPRRTPARASSGHRSRATLGDRAIPLLLLWILIGLGMSIWIGRGRGGFTRLPSHAGSQAAECRQSLEWIATQWRTRCAQAGSDVNAAARGFVGFACTCDVGLPYAVRDVERAPIDPSRAADEPIVACLGLVAKFERWRPPHGDSVLILFADGSVRELTWDDLDLDGAGEVGGPEVVVGPDARSPLLRVLRAGR